MNVVSSKDNDVMLLNIELAKGMTESVKQLHIIKGALGYRVRIDVAGSWKIINFRNPKLTASLEMLLGLKVTEENGIFYATLPGQYVYAKSDDRAVAVAMAASKVSLKPGSLAAAL